MDRRWMVTTGTLVLAIALGVVVGRWTAAGPADANAARPAAVSCCCIAAAYICICTRKRMVIGGKASLKGSF